MESLLTPTLALAYLRELSVDLLGAVVVDSDGRSLAGDSSLASPARALLDAGGGPQFDVRTSGGWVFCARSERFAIVLVMSPLALPDLVRHDLGEVAALLDGGRIDRAAVPGAGSSPTVLRGLADAVHGALPSVATLSSGDR